MTTQTHNSGRPATPITVLYLDHTAKLSGGEIALARALAETDRAAVTPVVLLAEDGPLVGRLGGLGVETHVLPLSARVRDARKDGLGRGLGAAARLRAVADLAAYAAAVARFARRRGADVIHTNSLKSDVYGALAGRLAGVPVVWHVRDHVDAAYLPGPAAALFRLLARTLPQYVVSNSRSTEERLRLPAHVPRRVVHGGLSFDQIAGPNPHRGSHARVVYDGLVAAEMPDSAPARAAGPPRVGMVGRIAPWKGQHVFLDAAARLTAAGHDARFLVVGAPLFGEDAYDAGLRRQAADSGLGDRVEFAGFLADVPAALRGLDVLVHASTTPEPFGQVIIEGMAQGLPVVATDGGGAREIVRHGENGLLVPMGDAGALADAVGGLLRDPARARRLAAAGFRHVRAHFTAAQTARQLEQVYADVLENGRRGRARGGAVLRADQ